MRPVFNDYVTEIQRSIGYFGSVNRAAKIKKVIGVGNGFKLAGLQKFLQQNLQYEVERLEHLDGVTGDGVLSDPLFMDNVMTFAVPYGLALQTLRQTRIRTTLLPPEIVTERKIRSKKPWVVAAAAGLLLALGISTGVTASVKRSVGEERFKEAYAAVDKLKSFVSTTRSNYTAEETAHKKMVEQIKLIAAPLERRSLWMELYKTVNECLPRDEGNALDEVNLGRQKKIRIESLVSKRAENVADWHAAIVAEQPLKEKFLGDDGEKGPSGQGYIITLEGHHYYNDDELGYRNIREAFVENTLVTNLRNWTIDRESLEVPVGQLGISHPIVVWSDESEVTFDPNGRSLGRGTGFDGYGYPGQNMPSLGATGGMGLPGGFGAGGFGAGGAGGFGGSRFGGVGAGDDDDDDYYGYEYGPGANGPDAGRGRRGRNRTPIDVIEDDEKKIQKLTKTTFMLQFAWVPVLENDREDNPPTDAPASQSSAQ